MASHTWRWVTYTVPRRSLVPTFGTPVRLSAYSFSEDHEKSVVIIEMDPTGTVSTSTIPVGVGRGVHTITGEMAQLLDPGFAPEAVDCFVRAVVTDRDTVFDAKAKLVRLYPYVAEVRLRPLGENPGIEDPSVEISELPPLEATKEFWMAAEGDDPPPGVTELLADAIAHAQTVEAGAS